MEILTDSTFVSTPEPTLAESPLALYPNPASELLHIDFLSKTTDNISVILRIFDDAGRLVLQKTRKTSNGRTFIELRDLAPGTYFLEISPDGKRGMGQKFVVVRPSSQSASPLPINSRSPPEMRAVRKPASLT